MADDQSVLGLPELDPELYPSLPVGWLGLLIGGSGSGTPMFAKQFAHAMVGSSPVLYYTTTERTEDVHQAFRDHGWDPGGVQIVNLAEEYFANVLLRALDVSRSRQRGIHLADLAGEHETGVDVSGYDLTNRLLADLAGLDSRFRLVLDSLDFFLEVQPVSEVMTLVRQIRHRAAALGGQALLLLHGDIHERRVTGLLEDMADLIVELTARPVGATYAHTLAVRKLRNHPERTRIVPARITDRGLELLAPTDASAK